MTLLDQGFHIRRGTEADIPVCDQIARMQEALRPSSLGWVRRDSFVDFHVACLGDSVVGFVIFHRGVRGMDAGWNVIHALAVLPRAEGQGVGRNLVYSVECPVRLRCPQFVDGDLANIANEFYLKAGLRCNAVETHYRGGARRGETRANPLNVWEMPILPIFVMGSNKEIPEAARQSGWAYGTREIEPPMDWAYQVDIDLGKAEGDWRRYKWDRYLEKIARWKPFAALVVDYFEPEQKDTMLRQVADLKALCVERILVCPKFVGACADIPQDCIVAVSVPSRYAGFIPPHEEVRGRRVHLLGGSPTQWFGCKSGRKKRPGTGLILSLRGAGARIISVDGNSHEASAQTGTYWYKGTQKRPVNGRFVHGDRFGTMVFSGREIVESLHQSMRHIQRSDF